MRELLVGKNDAEQRLDKFLKKSTVGLPDALLHKYLRKKCVKVNGAHVTDGGYTLKKRDCVQVYMNEEFFVPRSESFRTLAPEISIVYEDENLLICDKPAGLSCHADARQDCGTLIDGCKAYLYAKGEYDPQKEQSFAPALANRIDRNTAGLVLCAKNAASLRALCEMIRARRVEKVYRALCVGSPEEPEGTLRHFLWKDAKQNRVLVYDAPHPGAKTAVTHYRTLYTRDGISLLEIRLETGRTHQIRAQLAHIGCPLVGDAKYAKTKGKDSLGFAYQALLSYSVRFFPDETDEPLCYLSGKTVSLKTFDGRFSV